MEEKQRHLFICRLKEIFGTETQNQTADKLNTSQSNVNKWVNGTGFPTAETLFFIAKVYKVSIDWLLGLSESREIDGMDPSLLTYEHAVLMLDELMKNGNIEVPNLRQVNKYNKEKEDEDEDNDENDLNPVYDSDYIKINDLALSFILRRRMKYYDIDEADLDYWVDRVVNQFKGLRILNYKGNAPEAIKTVSWAVFKQGDWAELVNQLNNMTEDEMMAMIEEEKEGKEDGE